MIKTTTFRNTNGNEEPAYFIVKQRSKHRDFVILKREGIKKLLDPNLGVNDLRLILWLGLSIEPGTDYVIACSQLIISQALNISQPAISGSLRCLFLLGIIKKAKLENGLNIWVFENRFITRKRNQ
jgi:hypothetical protein